MQHVVHIMRAQCFERDIWEYNGVIHDIVELLNMFHDCLLSPHLAEPHQNKETSTNNVR